MLRTMQTPDSPITLEFTGMEIGMTGSHHPRKENDSKSSRRSLNKALMTVAVLQTTLELTPLLRLFSREVRSNVMHCGVHYKNDINLADISVGRMAKHGCMFHLLVDRDKLGEITFYRGKPFTQSEMLHLEFMLSSLVYPLRNALQYQSAFRASMTDPLTGGYNRLVMESALKHEEGLFHRYKTPLSLLVIDIDRFKAINDKHGHEAGDKVIKAVAEAISHCLRETDILSRYGGDEFTVLLSNTRIKGAVKIAEHIRETISILQVIHDDLELAVTVSIGVASLNSADKTGNLFHRADKALLTAKREKRNTIRIANYR